MYCFKKKKIQTASVCNVCRLPAQCLIHVGTLTQQICCLKCYMFVHGSYSGFICCLLRSPSNIPILALTKEFIYFILNSSVLVVHFKMKDKNEPDFFLVLAKLLFYEQNNSCGGAAKQGVYLLSMTKQPKCDLC